jgi:hypothetical protein
MQKLQKLQNYIRDMYLYINNNTILFYYRTVIL